MRSTVSESQGHQQANQCSYWCKAPQRTLAALGPSGHNGGQPKILAGAMKSIRLRKPATDARTRLGGRWQVRGHRIGGSEARVPGSATRQAPPAHCSWLAMQPRATRHNPPLQEGKPLPKHTNSTDLGPFSAIFKRRHSRPAAASAYVLTQRMRVASPGRRALGRAPAQSAARRSSGAAGGAVYILGGGGGLGEESLSAGEEPEERVGARWGEGLPTLGRGRAGGAGAW